MSIVKDITSTTTEVTLLHKGFEFFAKPHGFRAVVRRQHVAQVLHDHIPNSFMKSTKNIIS